MIEKDQKHCLKCKIRISETYAAQNNGLCNACEVSLSFKDKMKLTVCFFILGPFIGIVLGFPIGELLVKLFKVSSFEGGSGYFVILIVIPSCVLLSSILSTFIAYRLIIKKKRTEQNMWN